MSKSPSPTAVITGASSGIGAATAKKFAREGWNLILLGRNLKRLNETKEACSLVQVKCLSFDLKDIEQNKEQLISVLESAENIKALVNNAGIFKTGKIETEVSADWQNQFQVNLLGPALLTKILWPIFVKNNGGSIVNVSSTLGLKPTAQTGIYSALKAALNNWTVSLAQQGGENNIRANAVCPGIVDTPIHTFYNLPISEKKLSHNGILDLQLLKFIGQPDHIADSIYFLASDYSKWTTGTILNVDGGINIK